MNNEAPMGIKETQSILLDLLKNFDSFAKENGIRYYVASGTCLGAVRENGFIPWDADIDIFLPLDMYQKAESILLHQSYKDIKWLSYKTNCEAPNLMGRIYEDSVSLNNLEQFPYIDLFALSGIPADEKKQAKIMKKSLMNYRIYWIKKRKYRNSLFRKKSLIGYVLQKLLFFYPSSKCIKEFESSLQKYPYNYSDYIAPLTGLYGIRDVVNREWFEDEPIFVRFCDMMVPVSRYVHEYLSHQYGENYMTPIQYNRYK